MTLLRDLGSPLSPQDAFQIIQGLEALALRFMEHSRNATRVADFLAKNPAVISANYPRLNKGVVARWARLY